jgi:hypothetical protein
MNSPEIKIEPLTKDEERIISKSRVAHLWLIIPSITLSIAFLTELILNASYSSIWELLFEGSVVVIVVLGLLFLAYLLVGIWRDNRIKSKLVVRGRVSDIHRKTSSYGLHYVIHVGDKYSASDPLYSPVPGYFARIQVGDWVEISYLMRSRRTLSVVPLKE